MKPIDTIGQITRHWKNRIGLLAVATAVICLPSVYLVGSWTEISLVSVIIVNGLILFLIFWFVYQVYPDRAQTIRLIDAQLPSLEYSSQLSQEEHLQGIALLQQQKMMVQLAQEHKNIRFPLPWSMLAFNLFITLFAAGLFLLLKLYKQETATPSQQIIKTEQQTSLSPDLTDSLSLAELLITVSPPAYTRLSTYSATKADLKIPVGSSVKLTGAFSSQAEIVSLSLNQIDHSIRPTSVRFMFEKEIIARSMYRITASREKENYQSPYHLIDVIKDQPPQIKIDELPQYQRFDWYEDIKIDLSAEITDDYALEEAYIVATITEGSGESIRFREQKISFDEPIQGNSVSLKKSWTASEFKLAPGNEFYFHVEAKDNRPPDGQVSKSSTYFFAINDTTDVEFSLVGDLGVDIMPDYFKSQLQLIIDTEKLLEERSQLTKQEFNFTSNELGFDQKQLRLRYGQFMGEEDDSGLEIAEDREPEAASTDDPGKVNVLEEFGHDHDHENEAGQWQDRGTQSAEETHGHEHEDEHKETEDPLEAFLHNHEDAETATFFTLSLKAKLRAALNEMWDAELYLRLFQPEKSLPYQYKALELLKEIKNHARIYVKRVGFEPIEINEASTRLTKEADGFSPSSHRDPAPAGQLFPALWALVQNLEVLSIQRPATIPRELWDKAGKELALLSLERPGDYLLELNAINKLKRTTLLNDTYVRECRLLKEQLINEVLSGANSPTIDSTPADDLNQFFKAELLKTGT